MTPLCAAIVRDHQARKSRAQKAAFRELVRAEMRKEGVFFREERAKGLLENVNLVYGNIAGRNFIRMLLSKAEIEMPGHAWGTLQNMWIGFFAAMGVVNLLVAYLCSTDTWVNFKLFGLMGLTLVFTIGIGVFMTKHAVTRQN